MAAEPGLIVLSKALGGKDLEALEVDSSADITDVYKYLTSKEGETVETVFIDSLTEICDIVMKEIFKTVKDGRQAYGEFGVQMKKMIKAFRDIPNMNVFFTALDTVEMDDLNRRYIGPNVPGKTIKEILPSLFDLVLYYDLQRNPETQEEQRVLITGNHKQYPGKDRTGKLPLFAEPDLQVIINNILS